MKTKGWKINCQSQQYSYGSAATRSYVYASPALYQILHDTIVVYAPINLLHLPTVHTSADWIRRWTEQGANKRKITQVYSPFDNEPHISSSVKKVTRCYFSIRSYHIVWSVQYIWPPQRLLDKHKYDMNRWFEINANIAAKQHNTANTNSRFYMKQKKSAHQTSWQMSFQKTYRIRRERSRGRRSLLGNCRR